jgi:hypothetical protein
MTSCSYTPAGARNRLQSHSCMANSLMEWRFISSGRQEPCARPHPHRCLLARIGLESAPAAPPPSASRDPSRRALRAPDL